jgi:hypothetical protein
MSIDMPTDTSIDTSAETRRRPSAWWFDPYLWLILVVALFPIAPMLQPGYQWDAHDARHSVYFLVEFDRGIQGGNLYPRWQPDFAFGYGYPFFNIYGPLAFYVAEVLHLLGLGFAGAIKAVFALSVLASGLAMYGFVKRVLGRRPGLVAAAAYMVIPYRLVDVYVRAGLAESVAYVFVPLVLWGVWAAVDHPRLANVLGLALAYAALLLTHPLTALLLTLILVFYIALLALARINDEQPWRRLSRESLLPLVGHLGHVLLPVAVALVLGVGLSAISALPSMTENRYVRLDQWYGGRYAWGGDFVDFFQLFSPRWGFGASVPGPDDDVSFQLGAVPLVLSLMGAGAVLYRRQARRLVLFFAALTAVAVLLMLGISAPLWQALPLVRLAQFPWRLLTLTVFAMGFLCGAAALGPRRLNHRDTEGTEALRQEPHKSPCLRGKSPGPGQHTLLDVPTLILVVLLVLGSLPYMQAQMSQREVSLGGLMQFQQSADEMTGSTAWARVIPSWSPLADYHIAGQPLTSNVDFDSLYRQPGRPHARTLALTADRELVEFWSERPVLLTFNTFYYPGWHAYLVDAETGDLLRELPIALRGELGLMTVRLPEGVGQVLLRFEQTPIRSLATAITWISLALAAGLALLAAIGARRRRKRSSFVGAGLAPAQEGDHKGSPLHVEHREGGGR